MDKSGPQNRDAWTIVVKKVVVNGQNKELVQRVGNERLAAVVKEFSYS